MEGHDKSGTRANPSFAVSRLTWLLVGVLGLAVVAGSALALTGGRETETPRSAAATQGFDCPKPDAISSASFFGGKGDGAKTPREALDAMVQAWAPSLSNTTTTQEASSAEEVQYLISRDGRAIARAWVIQIDSGWFPEGFVRCGISE
jgi:hypothetical protein